MSPGTRKRIARIEKYGSPELMRAVQTGLLTPGGAERLLSLSAAGQIAELERRQAQRDHRELRSRRVTAIIGRYLDDHDGEDARIDLAELCGLLRASG